MIKNAVSSRINYHPGLSCSLLTDGFVSASRDLRAGAEGAGLPPRRGRGLQLCAQPANDP